MTENVVSTEKDIIYLQHRITSESIIAIEFKIKGNLFTRVSMLKNINDFHKNSLLWWKRNADEYCDENQSKELEGIIKAFIMPESFKEQLQIELP